MAFRRGGEWAEHDKAVNWVMASVGIALMVMIIGSVFAIPLAQLFAKGFSQEHLNETAVFFKKVAAHPDLVFASYARWIKLLWNSKEGTLPLSITLIPAIPFILMPIIIVYGVFSNPYAFGSQCMGGSRLAEMREVKEMKLLDGFCMVLGKFKGKFLKLPETLSVLCCAPPGTGKTVGVVIPTILHSPGLSLIVNDPKPELCFKTSGARALEGPVFIVNWGAEDKPDEGLFYPCWNPLSPACLPPAGPPRDMYVDSMNTVLVEEPKGGADPHWAKTGRNAMAGFVHFICGKCERALANDYFISRLYEGKLDREDQAILETYYLEMKDPDAAVAIQNLRAGNLNLENYVPIGTWEMLPESWIGGEPCLAMILDWLTEAQMQIAADLKKRTEEGDQMAAFADPMRDMLDAAVAECEKFGYSHRAVLELNQLSGTPDKERGSIMSTALTGIGAFKNAAVRARTSSSDFTFKDLRGMPDPVSGEMRPSTVYLSVNQVDARALSMITGVFIELMSSYMIANPPNFVGPDGKVGPFPILFVLDEFPQMPKLNAIKDGPAVGRGQKVSYLLVGQDLGQISGQYGKDDLETIISTTAVKVILPQNNEQTAERFGKMIGKRTIVVKSTSRTEGMSKNATPFSSNVSRSLQGADAFGAGDMMTMPAEKQLIMMQGWFHRPIFADAPRYYKDKHMTKLCELPSAPPVPDWIVEKREG